MGTPGGSRLNIAIVLLALFIVSDLIAVGGDASQPTWVRKAGAPAGIYLAAGAAAVIKDKIYVPVQLTTANSEILAYAPGTNHWEVIETVPKASGHSAIVAFDNKLFVLGGWSCRGLRQTQCFGMLANVWTFDPANGQWEELVPMPTARAGLAAAVLDGKIYAVGGFRVLGESSTITLNTVEVYDPSTNTWQSGPSLLHARNEFALAEVGGKLFALGGNSNHGMTCDPHLPMVSSMEVFDGEAWNEKGSIPTRRTDLGVAVVGSRIYAIGGANSMGDGMSVVEVYDTATDTWVQDALYPEASAGMAVAVVGNMIYASGGFGSWCGGDYSTSTWALEVPR